MRKELSVEEILEGFHLASLLHGLDRLGVLDEMTSPTAPADLAATTHVDSELLCICLEYIAGRTTLVERDGRNYLVTVEWNEYARACVRQYIGAYGRPSTEVAAVLRDPSVGPALVDHEEQARSYSRAPTAARLVADLVLQLDLTPTLDLGCGSASMLVELGCRRPDFVGWGVDASPEMCAAARARVAENRLGDRITIVHGDAFAPNTIADLQTLNVRAITATSLLNELWDLRHGRPSVTAWLQSMAETFPGRAVVIADYFGRLGRTPPPWPTQTAVHDLVQALSGQGIPPPDHDAWRNAYSEASADLLHMIEDEAKSFFIHLLRLSGDP